MFPKKHRAKGYTVFKPTRLPWPCPFSAATTLNLVATNNSPYPEVMLSVVKEKPHFPVSMWKKHLLQRNDIWMFELPQQLQNKESPQQLYPHTLSSKRAGKMNTVTFFATYSTIQTIKVEICKSRKTAHVFLMPEPVISLKPKLQAGHSPLRAFTSYSFPKSWSLCKPHYYPGWRRLSKKPAVASALSHRL